MSIFSDKRLGFGFMRLPLNDDGTIDIDESCKLVDLYMDRGFNYFDTAYGYHDEKSENAVKQCVVQRYSREKFCIADKLPVWLIENESDPQKLFDEQRERAGVDYFDYYLLHALSNSRIKTLDDNNVWAFMQKQKELGTAKYIGFSFHDKAEILDKILTAHPIFDFVQLQINYIDWDSDNIESRKCYEIARRHNVEIIVMEPVKGGLLVNFKDEYMQMLKEYAPDKNIASWALRYVASLEGVGMLLSGMHNMQQVDENTKTMANFAPLTSEERSVLDNVTNGILSVKTIGCTSCEYCVKGCPVNLKIPQILASYNSYLQYGIEAPGVKNAHVYVMAMAGKAGDCIECGQCEGVCPQHLEIIKAMNETAQLLEN